MTTTGKLTSSIGKGLVAGLIGTASMTVSSTVEARLRHRKPSSAPARATAKVLGISSFAGEIAQARFNDRMNLRPAPDRRGRVCPRLPGACTRSRPEQPLTGTEGAAP